jgi:hypothetical protein
MTSIDSRRVRVRRRRRACAAVHCLILNERDLQWVIEHAATPSLSEIAMPPAARGSAKLAPAPGPRSPWDGGGVTLLVGGASQAIEALVLRYPSPDRPIATRYGRTPANRLNLWGTDGVEFFRTKVEKPRRERAR